MGASCKLNNNLKTIIYAAVKRGLSYKDTCMLAGISESSFYNWLRTRPDFKKQIEYNKVHGKLELIRAVADKRLEDWRAAAWLLSHKYPAEFSERRVITTDDKSKPTPWELMNEVISKGEPVRKEESETEPA